MRKVFTATLLLAVLALILACFVSRRKTVGGDDSQKIQYEDLVGRKMRIAKDVRRIVLLRSKDIYLLAALLGDELPNRLVAWGPDLKVDDAEVYKRLLERFPHLGEITVTGDVYSDGLDVEQLVRIGADLIIGDKYMIDRGYKYTEKLDSTGLPVVYLDGSNDPLTGAQNGIRLLGKILNRRDRAQAISKYLDDQIGLVVSRIESNAPPPPSVYIEAGDRGPAEYSQTYGHFGASPQQTSWGAILKTLKVRNIADGRVVGMAPINPEALLKADPDIIVLTGQNWSQFKNSGGMQLGFNVNIDDARHLLHAFTGRPGWNLLSAVKNRRVYSVFHSTVSPTVFSGVQALAKYCYPDLFRDVDPERNLKEFYDRFMPIAYEGTWMCSLDPQVP